MDAGGNLVSSVKYTANSFSLATSKCYAGEVRSVSGVNGIDYRYTGQREETEIGLYFYKARFYDPALARFVQADTIVPGPGSPQSWDRYSYVQNNPIRYSDPSGHYICEGIYRCDPLPSSAYTKNYYQNQLISNYSWIVDSGFSYQESKFLYEVALEMRTFFSNVTSGHGKTWMDKNLGQVNFSKGDFYQRVMSYLNGNRPTSFVYPDNEVHLMDNFMNLGGEHIVHELTHVIDNKMSGKIATISGGGPADELVKFLGGIPEGTRFKNGNFDIPKAYKFKSPHEYGNNSYADFFAESMAVWMYEPKNLPPKVELWLEALVDLTK